VRKEKDLAAGNGKSAGYQGKNSNNIEGRHACGLRTASQCCFSQTRKEKVMKYVVYHVASTMEKKAFKSAGVAMTVAEKMNVALGKAEYAAASDDYYKDHVVKMVEKVNMMSGATYKEASNTAGYMSPSSEAYWSM
jgi:hypothetical protein